MYCILVRWWKSFLFKIFFSTTLCRTAGESTVRVNYQLAFKQLNVMWWWSWKISFHRVQKYLLLGFHAWLSFSPLDSFINNSWLGAPTKAKMLLSTNATGARNPMCIWTPLHQYLFSNAAKFLSSLYMKL